MKIPDYLKKHSMSSADFANLVGVTPAMVSQWLSEHRPISPAKCVTIEQKTNGEVTRKELRPDDWPEIWPELIEAA